MKRRDVFWLALAVVLLVPLVVTVVSASVGIAEFAVISTIIIIVAASLLGRSFFRGLRASAAPERERLQVARSPALIIGLGVLAFALLGIVVAAAVTNVSSPAASLEQTPAPTPVTVQPAGPREVNPADGLIGPLVGVVVGAGLLFAAYLFFSRHHTAPPAPEEPAVDVPTLDWREMLAGDDAGGDDGDDVAWWVQQLSNKDDPKR